MTNPALQALDARLAVGFKATGWADGAVFKSMGVAVPSCTVYVDRGVQLIGDQSQVIDDQITITGFLAQIGKVPARGDTWTIGSEQFVVDSISSKDESEVICVVTIKGIC